MIKKATIMAIASLGAMSLVGTGFAGWVIASTVTKTAEGNIVAYAVTDNSVELSVSTNSEIKFGKPENMEVQNAWLTATTDVAVEALSFDITITVTSHAATVQPTSRISLEVQQQSGDQWVTSNTWADAVAAKYVAQPTAAMYEENGTTAVNVVDGNIFGTLTKDEPTIFHYKGTFAWGDYFGGQNPYDFYNAKNSSDTSTHENAGGKTWAQDANEALTAINGLSGLRFLVTVTAATGA